MYRCLLSEHTCMFFGVVVWWRVEGYMEAMQVCWSVAERKILLLCVRETTSCLSTVLWREVGGFEKSAWHTFKKMYLPVNPTVYTSVCHSWWSVLAQKCDFYGWQVLAVIQHAFSRKLCVQLNIHTNWTAPINSMLRTEQKLMNSSNSFSHLRTHLGEKINSGFLLTHADQKSTMTLAGSLVQLDLYVSPIRVGGHEVSNHHSVHNPPAWRRLLNVPFTPALLFETGRLWHFCKPDNQIIHRAP